MKRRTHRTLLVGLVLVALLSACSYTVRLPFAPGDTCRIDCESADRVDKRPAALRLLLGP